MILNVYLVAYYIYCDIAYCDIFCYSFISPPGSQLPMVDRSFIYVIVDLAKNNFRQTEYKVTNLVSGDSWVRLKRGKGKSGIEFRVLRKVYFPPEKEQEKEGGSKKLEAVAETPE